MAQINKPNLHFNTVLYTGTGSGGSNRQITGVGFQPDFTWVKTRGSAQEHVLVDAVRGATKSLDSQTTTAEATTTTQVGAFISDGFQLGSGAVQNRVNQSGIGMVSWNWKAGTTTGITTNGDTTITPSSYSFTQTAGFSIVTYTGNTTAGAGVPHGLGIKPQLIIVKRLDAVSPWQVYNQPFINTSNATKYLVLNGNDEEATATTKWNGYQPDSTNFYLGTDSQTNTGNYVAYCFANIKGFSKFGKYVGNGNADGTFVYTGFKPAFVLYKRTDGSTNWSIFDNKRDSFNEIDAQLNPNLSAAEGTSLRGDFLSNGWKIRATAGSTNASGGNYIYMAFAEHPLVGTNGVPATAR